MNRTDRLYGLVEELRAVSPRPRSARRLAERFEVSVRTIERDPSALQQSGLPIWAEPGRTGGYVIDASATLGPAGFTFRRGASAKRIGPRVVLSGTPPRPTRSPASASSARTSSARNHLETAPRLPCG
ncbi:helix-turn-helix transcriptional regulator [Rathayibacter festucae]|uniref:helix-turn-helix transcriptional regulator n=1 Tax=Rathayibacter festucae TaxID=110937 RepID=UPI003CC51B87